MYERLGRIFSTKKSNLVALDKSFRCTNQILRFSMKLLPQAVEIKSFNRDGDEPGVHTAPDRPALCEQIASEAEFCLQKGYRSIGLICKTEKNALALYKQVKDQMDVQLVKNGNTAELQGALIMPVYMAKGLEFDVVFVCDAGFGNYRSEDDKKLLYIACTRALHRLHLFSLGEASPLLRD